jgi:hypothetical protein
MKLKKKPQKQKSIQCLIKAWTYLLSLIVFTTACSCARVQDTIEPSPVIAKHPKEVQREKKCALILPKDFSTSPFKELSPSELAQEWGKEYFLATHFAQDFDLYRSITNFKRALYLLPEKEVERKNEVLYQITLAYFLGRKYSEVIHTIEATTLKDVNNKFPAYKDLLIILYESFKQEGKLEASEAILKKLDNDLPQIAEKLALCSAVQTADFAKLEEQSKEKPYIGRMMNRYHKEAKSVRKAELLNACLPGAGYWYLGQKQTAMTAFLVNSLFLGTAAYFFADGNIPAGTIALSIEGGWYFGGIYGAGLSAKHYNEKLYSGYADKIYKKEKCFPMMMLNYSF